jgi:hypothetical protein
MEKNTWPAKSEMAVGWTARYPRPTEGDGHHPATLTFKQQTWDEAEALRVRFATRSAEIHAESAHRGGGVLPGQASGTSAARGGRASCVPGQVGPSPELAAMRGR